MYYSWSGCLYFNEWIWSRKVGSWRSYLWGTTWTWWLNLVLCLLPQHHVGFSWRRLHSYTISVSGSATCTWSSAMFLAELINWNVSPIRNFGWLMKAREPTGIYKEFFSCFASNEEYRPTITVKLCLASRILINLCRKILRINFSQVNKTFYVVPN